MSTMVDCVVCDDRGCEHCPAVGRAGNTIRRRPSDAQVETFKKAIEAWRRSDATLKAEMQDDGDMLLLVHEDGLTRLAFFGRDGKLAGDWH